MFDATSIGTRALTLFLSVSAHAAVALVAAHGGSVDTTSLVSEGPIVELAAPEMEPVERAPEALRTEVGRAPSSAIRSHRHPYPVPLDHDAHPHDPSLPHLPIAPIAPIATEDHDSPLASAPNVLEAPAQAGPRFVMTVGRANEAPGGASAAKGDGNTPGVAAVDEPIPEASAETPATLLAGNPPKYTREAAVAGVEADVPLEIVVDGRGAVVNARALARVGYGLDEAALLGIRAYRFTPARRHGRPASVRMRWMMRFQLK